VCGLQRADARKEHLAVTPLALTGSQQGQDMIDEVVSNLLCMPGQEILGMRGVGQGVARI
jgi:hypothetical protein